MASTLGLVVNCVALAVYSNALYFMTTNRRLRNFMDNVIDPPGVADYGQLRFLTFQCLLLQILSSFLHVGAHFLPILRKPRDIVFLGVAYPIGSIVVYSFWAVWHLVGRELIFPAALSEVFPDWLNHSVHTVIVPINLLTLVLVNHKPNKYAISLIVIHSLEYMFLLIYIKKQTGFYVYRYLDHMSTVEVSVYLAFTFVGACLMYKCGVLLNDFVHPRRKDRP